LLIGPRRDFRSAKTAGAALLRIDSTPSKRKEFWAPSQIAWTMTESREFPEPEPEPVREQFISLGAVLQNLPYVAALASASLSWRVGASLGHHSSAAKEL
jgi:hypothetical protein